MTVSHPKTFISYAWEDDAHKAWVRALATRLRADGVDATLDQWSIEPGDPLTSFMESAVRENEFVLIVCTPKYRDKANLRSGGVGYEANIMTSELAAEAKQSKFIPILRRGDDRTALPTWLQGKYYLDFRQDTT